MAKPRFGFALKSNADAKHSVKLLTDYTHNLLYRRSLLRYVELVAKIAAYMLTKEQNNVIFRNLFRHTATLFFVVLTEKITCYSLPSFNLDSLYHMKHSCSKKDRFALMVDHFAMVGASCELEDFLDLSSFAEP
jgi:hypothetical protein